MKKNLYIEGMKCQNCVRHVKEALSEVDGVKVIDVNLSKGVATVETNDENNQSLENAMKETHYTLKKIETV